MGELRMDHNYLSCTLIVNTSFFRFLITTAPIKNRKWEGLEHGRSKMKWLYFLFMAFISTHNQAGENIYPLQFLSPINTLYRCPALHWRNCVDDIVYVSMKCAQSWLEFYFAIALVILQSSFIAKILRPQILVSYPCLHTSDTPAAVSCECHVTAY